MSNNIKCSICDSICDSLDFKFKNSVTSDNRFIKKDISYSYCNNCDYIFVDYDKRIDLEKFYQKEYNFLLDSDEVEPEIDGVKYSEYLVTFFAEYIKHENKNFLDIGAGKGNLIETFYKKFKNLNFFAIEPSSAYIKLNEKKYIKEKYHGFFNNDVFKNTKFDYITLVEVLEHVSNPKTFLLSICEIMNEESLMLIEVPNFKNHKSDLLTIDHLSLFTESNLIYLFNKCGLEVVKKNVSNRVPMQFIVKLNKCKNIDSDIINESNLSLILYEQATRYIKKVISDAVSVKNEPIAIYGQNIILDYLIGNEYLKLSNIECIINDNKHYQGEKKWNSKIDVVGVDDFKKNTTTDNVLLAMNDCYHNKVMSKLENKKIYGILDDLL